MRKFRFVRSIAAVAAVSGVYAVAPAHAAVMVGDALANAPISQAALWVGMLAGFAGLGAALRAPRKDDMFA